MSSGGSHPNAGMITRNGFPGGSQPGLALGRRVPWFIDNCSAMSSCVHGYASKLDMARMANAVQMALCGLEVWAHFEWVPSDANISDIPSRVDSVSSMNQVESKVWAALKLPGEGDWDVMRFPSREQLEGFECFLQPA